MSEAAPMPLINSTSGDKFSKAMLLIEQHTKVLLVLATLAAMLLSAGCSRPLIVGGIDASNLDLNFEPGPPPPGIDENSTRPNFRKAPSQGGPIVSAAGVSGQTGGAAAIRRPEMILAEDGAYGQGKEHIYIDKASGPVSVMLGRVYHWVGEGGLLVPGGISPDAPPSMTGEILPGEGEPVPVIEGATPKALFRVDEVVALVRKYESAMRGRRSQSFSDIFTDSSMFDFAMEVPRDGVIRETYDLEHFMETHRRGWRVNMDYEFTVRDVAVTIGDDGTTAIAEGRAVEIMTAKGNRITADYSVRFDVEKQGRELRFTGLKAEGKMHAEPANQLW